MILLLHPLAEQAKRISYCLSAIGLPCYTCLPSDCAAQMLKTGCKVVIMDLQQDAGSGLDLCRDLREQQPDLIIIMTSSTGSEMDRILALELGADDIINLPEQEGELQARVKVQLRRLGRVAMHHVHSQTPTPASAALTSAALPDHSILKLKELVLDTRSHHVSLAGQTLNLTATEFALLVFFVRHPNQVFSRQQLLESVWDCHYDGYEHTVVSHINRLRNKLSAAPHVAAMLETVRGVGYRLSPARHSPVVSTLKTASRNPEKQISLLHR